MKKKILVVDDDSSILDAVAIILDQAGYNVETTPKGEETFTKVNSFQPDLILLDVLMSGKDGRDICKKLKNDTSTSNIPIVMISAHPSAESSIKECGADKFLEKPFDTSDLLDVASKYLK